MSYFSCYAQFPIRNYRTERKKKDHPTGWLHTVLGLDRSGEKPYCAFIILYTFSLCQ